MLTIVVPEREMYDEMNNEFSYTKETTLQLEHSLISLSKWEQKWHKAYLADNSKTREELLDYIRCMTITSNVDRQVYNCMTDENIKDIVSYIQDPMTATTFSNIHKEPRTNEVYTAELIYYSMIAAGIPFSCEKWHLNKLLTLLRVCSIKNKPPEKIPKGKLMERNRRLNMERRNRLKSRG